MYIVIDNSDVNESQVACTKLMIHTLCVAVYTHNYIMDVYCTQELAKCEKVHG